VLLGLQAARAVVSLVLWSAFPPDGDLSWFQALNAASFLAVGLAALALARPSPSALGLSAPASRLERAACLLLGGLFAFMLTVSLALNPGQAARTLHFALVVPALEELLFRGYAWGRLEPAMPTRCPGLVTCLTTARLFSLWHLGYADVLARHPAGADLLVALEWKLVIGAVLGLATGFLRWRTDRVFGPILFHGFWNLMAP